MRSFDEICQIYEKTPEELERELFKTLSIIDERQKPVIVNQEFYTEKVAFLQLKGYISREWPLNKITPEGKRAIKQGYVHLNIKAIEEQENRALIKTLLITIFPRLKGFWEFILKE